jgi:hypothetical protein
MIIYGIKWECEVPCQLTDIERASVSAIGQGVV